MGPRGWAEEQKVDGQETYAIPAKVAGAGGGTRADAGCGGARARADARRGGSGVWRGRWPCSQGDGREGARSMVQVTPLAVPQPGSCASSRRAWRLRAARHSQSEAQPLGAQPPPRGLKRAASKVADFTAS